MITRAAGILLRDKKTGQVLFLKRGIVGDFAGHWCFPGGKTEGDETPEQTAERETLEEIGTLPDGQRSTLCRTVTAIAPQALAPVAAPGGVGADSPPAPTPIPDSVDFTTFLLTVDGQPQITIDGEHVGSAWSPADQPPEPLHPGCRVALAMLSADELAIARMMADGSIQSPHRYQNVSLFLMRITGTGVAYRRKKDEFVWRDPTMYLNDEFLARCSGLPVIYHHPEKAVLDSKEFADRVVGMILLPFIRGDEVWGIAKIYDDDAIREMIERPMSTSPAIVLGDPSESTKLKMDNGSIILIEGRPSLLDHLAICERGVWDKGGEPSGIPINDSTSTMETTMADKDDDKVRQDAEELEGRRKADAENGSKLDKLLTHMDSFGTRLDAMEKRQDAADEGAARRVAADAEDEAKKKADAEAEEKRKADEDEAKKKADAEAEEKRKADSDVMARIADVESRLPMAQTDADYAAVTACQADADEVFSAFGSNAPRPLSGETSMLYRRRVAGMLKEHSPAWKGVALEAIADDTAFAIAEGQIRKDAMHAAMFPTDIPEGQMRPITARDRVTGHMVTRFAGRSSFIRDFSSPRRNVTNIKQRRSDLE